MTIFRIALVALLALWGSAPLVRAQEDSSPAKPKTPTAEEVLREVDSRIWSNRRAGLVDLQLTWKIAATGELAGILDGLSIRYAWKQPEHWIAGLVDAEGREVPTPKELEDEVGQALLQHLTRSIHVMARQLVVGLTLSERYADYHKELKTRLVNNKREYRVILRPRSKKAYSEQVLRIIDGVPVELKKTDVEGRVETHVMIHEKRGEHWLLTGLKLEQGGRLISEETMTYEKRGGFYLLTKLERMINREIAEAQGVEGKQVTRLDEILVNQGLSDAQFGVPPAEGEAPAGSDAPPRDGGR